MTAQGPLDDASPFTSEGPGLARVVYVVSSYNGRRRRHRDMVLTEDKETAQAWLDDSEDPRARAWQVRLLPEYELSRSDATKREPGTGPAPRTPGKP